MALPTTTTTTTTKMVNRERKKKKLSIEIFLGQGTNLPLFTFLWGKLVCYSTFWIASLSNSGELLYLKSSLVKCEIVCVCVGDPFQ